MEWIELDRGPVTEHDSRGLFMIEAARLASGGEFRAHVVEVAPGGLLGAHPTKLWQLFCVLTGEGWVSTEGGPRERIVAEQAVLWAPGETHESGSRDGMTALIVQASVRLPKG